MAIVRAEMRQLLCLVLLLLLLLLLLVVQDNCLRNLQVALPLAKRT